MEKGKPWVHCVLEQLEEGAPHVYKGNTSEELAAFLPTALFLYFVKLPM